MRDWRNQQGNNPLWRHSQLCHEGHEFELGVRVVRRDYGKPSRRLITESIAIGRLREDETMNNKREWTYTDLNKVSIS